MKIKIENLKPTDKQFEYLRKSVGWDISKFGWERIQQSLNSSPFYVTAWEERERVADTDKIIGMVRISGDDGMYGYIQDTIVIPEYQRQGIGKRMMTKLLKNIEGLEGYLLGVCLSRVSVNFYESFGFKKRQEYPNGFKSLEIGGR